MHFCMDEVQALLMLLPFAAFVRHWFKNVWSKRHTEHCCHKEKVHENA